MAWLSIEERFRDAVMTALLPPLHGRDLAPFWRRLGRAAPPALALALRGGVWTVALLPPLLLGRPHTVLGLRREEREQLLARAASSPLWPLRQVVTTLKMIACWAHFGDAEARAPFAPLDDVSALEQVAEVDDGDGGAPNAREVR